MCSGSAFQYSTISKCFNKQMSLPLPLLLHALLHGSTSTKWATCQILWYNMQIFVVLFRVLFLLSILSFFLPLVFNYVMVFDASSVHWSLVIICIPDKEEESGPLVLHLDSLGLHCSKSIFRIIKRLDTYVLADSFSNDHILYLLLLGVSVIYHSRV